MAWRDGECPICHGAMTYRDLAILEKIERRQRRAVPGRERSRAPVVPFSALLDDVRSLWNVGSIFRTADGAGFSLLYLCGITGCPPHRGISKTSLGAEESVDWVHHVNALEVLVRLRDAGVCLVCLERTKDSLPLTEALGSGTVKPPLCLVVGSEVNGVSAEARAVCDLRCHLPMRGRKESLNVAVAFGIAAYAIRENLSLGSDEGLSRVSDE